MQKRTPKLVTGSTYGFDILRLVQLFNIAERFLPEVWIFSRDVHPTLKMSQVWELMVPSGDGSATFSYVHK